jgi:hypothetical protein
VNRERRGTARVHDSLPDTRRGHAELTGLAFEPVWRDRVRRPFGEVEVDFLDRASFARNKRATGRLKDLSDVEEMV